MYIYDLQNSTKWYFLIDTFFSVLPRGIDSAKFEPIKEDSVMTIKRKLKLIFFGNHEHSWNIFYKLNMQTTKNTFLNRIIFL